MRKLLTFAIIITLSFFENLLAQPLFTASNPTCGGSSTITVPSTTFNTYYWNMGNGVTGTNYSPPTTTYTTLSSSTYTIQRTVTKTTPFKVISAISVIHTGGFQNCFLENSAPDYYLIIKNSAGTVLHTTPFNMDMNAPSSFSLSGILAAQSLNITVMEYDPSNLCVNLNMGTVTLPTNVSTGTYQTSSGSVIIGVTTQMVTSATYSKTVSVVAPAAIMTKTCGANGTITLSTSPVLAGATYQWSNGANTSSITVTTAGTYSVTLTTAASCSKTLSMAVTFGSKPIIACNGINLTCTNYTSFIRWKNLSGTTLSNSTTFTPTVAGTYYAEYWASSGGTCPARSLNMSFPSCVSGKSELQEDNEFVSIEPVLYPNPSTTGIFELKMPKDIAPEDLQFTIFDLSGRTIQQAHYSESILDLSTYPNGMYIVRFTHNGTTSTQKINISK